MDCAQFDEVLHDLDRPGTDGFALRRSALTHAEACGRCAQRLTEAESLDLVLRTLAAREADRQAPARVGAALMEEFRMESRSTSRRRVRKQLAALGVAAALLLVLGYSMRHRSAPAEKTAPVTDVAMTRPLSPVVTPPAALPDSQRDEAPVSQPVDSEYATAFVPLPYAYDSADLQDGAIVRVMLPRSALASLGMPVSYVGAADRVPADLVLSQDGTPQAIRLVSQESTRQDF